jgi:hypothetical protein
MTQLKLNDLYVVVIIIIIIIIITRIIVISDVIVTLSKKCGLFFLPLNLKLFFLILLSKIQKCSSSSTALLFWGIWFRV